MAVPPRDTGSQSVAGLSLSGRWRLAAPGPAVWVPGLRWQL